MTQKIINVDGKRYVLQEDQEINKFDPDIVASNLVSKAWFRAVFNDDAGRTAQWVTNAAIMYWVVIIAATYALFHTFGLWVAIPYVVGTVWCLSYTEIEKKVVYSILFQIIIWLIFGIWNLPL